MTEPLGHLIRRALKKPGDTAAVGVFGGIAYFWDAYNNILPFVEPGQAVAPGAALGVGLAISVRKGVDLRRKRSRVRRSRDFVQVLESHGDDDLAEKLKRQRAAYGAGQMSIEGFEERLDRIVAEFTRRL